MSDVPTQSPLAARNPEFARLQLELALATETFNRAVSEKETLIATLRNQTAVSLEDRKKLIECLKTERQSFRALQAVQEQFVAFLR